MRIHHPSPDVEARAVSMSLCGIPGSSISEHADGVTCKLCAKRFSREKKAKRPLASNHPSPIRDVLAIPTLPATRWGGGLPALTPDTYARRDCACGDCDLCDYYHDLELRGLHAEKRHGRKSEHRWTSVTAALESYAALLEDGYSTVKSAQGAFEELARVGAIVHSSKTDQTRRSHYEAAELAVIERVLELAFADERCGWRRAVSILLLRVVGVPQTIQLKFRAQTQRVVISEEEIAAAAEMEPLDVRSIVRRGRRRLLVELAAREWVPPPNENDRSYPEYLKRADEIEKTRVV